MVARTLLEKGRLVDVVAGVALAPGTSILVEGDRIAARLEPGSERPAGVRRLDLGGRSVIPGLFNTHLHLALPIPGTVIGLKEALLAKRHGREQVRANLVECLGRGITHLRDTLCENLEVSRRLRASLDQGLLEGPRLHQAVIVSQAGGTFAVEPSPVDRVVLPGLGLPVVDLESDRSGVVVFRPEATEAEVRRAVDRAIDERGADCVKVYEQREKKITYRPGATLMSQRQLDALLDQARARGLPSTMHCVSVESLRRGVRAGVGSLAHLPIDGPLADADARAFLAAGTLIEPTTTLAYFFSLGRELRGERPARLERLEALRSPGRRRELEDLWVPPLRPVLRKTFERALAGGRRSFGLFDVSAVYRYFSRTLTLGYDNLQRLVDEAGPSVLACGNDAGPCPSTPAGLTLELELLELCLNEDHPGRFTAADALRVATIQSARALGVERDFGSLEAGKVADLVVLDGDPQEDLRRIGQPAAAVFKGGALVVDRCGLGRG